ncbi:hypothetical protein GOHSU_16_01190 [Gordonia hirsuta DSM 44140 = NBRC 16056]|uniref:Uncharacterized protein n=1 Tax=Gordonia hirsuta DSM 44140 = NBRC 16056 TaxID=1121927 RepID=L7L8T6_9ACTN|nr:hypothetical protein [Gordonia hirsuta]GAC57161.1 hypothetical protein GOHSU_16_01190 [Gordonia hirsuta DSM 44140 = NBRC 16056]
MAVLVLVFGLSACGESAEPSPSAGGTAAASSSDPQVIAPVTVSVDDLSGATVQLLVGQVLNINTGSVPVDGYRGQIENGAVATFSPGHDDGSARFNPGVVGVTPGSTSVTMTDDQGGGSPVTFTVVVSPRGD